MVRSSNVLRRFGSVPVGAMVELLEERRLLAGVALDSFNVSSSGADATSNITLKKGVSYLIKVSGSASLGKHGDGSSRGVDAEYGVLYNKPNQWAVSAGVKVS